MHRMTFAQELISFLPAKLQKHGLPHSEEDEWLT